MKASELKSYQSMNIPPNLWTKEESALQEAPAPKLFRGLVKKDPFLYELDGKFYKYLEPFLSPDNPPMDVKISLNMIYDQKELSTMNIKRFFQRVYTPPIFSLPDHLWLTILTYLLHHEIASFSSSSRYSFAISRSVLNVQYVRKFGHFAKWSIRVQDLTKMIFEPSTFGDIYSWFTYVLRQRMFSQLSIIKGMALKILHKLLDPLNKLIKPYKFHIDIGNSFPKIWQLIINQPLHLRSKNMRPITLSCQENNALGVKFLLEEGAEISENDSTIDGFSLIEAALIYNNPLLLEYFCKAIEKEGQEFSKYDPNGEAMKYAVIYANKKTFLMLLNYYFKCTHEKDLFLHNAEVAFGYAIKHHKNTLAFCLLDYPIKLRSLVFEDKTPLMLACKYTNHDMYAYLLFECQQSETKINKINSKKKTLLHYVTKLFPIAQLKGLLPMEKLNRRQLDYKGRTPFYVSVERGNDEIIEFYLQTATVKDFQGMTTIGQTIKQAAKQIGCSHTYDAIMKKKKKLEDEEYWAKRRERIGNEKPSEVELINLRRTLIKIKKEQEKYRGTMKPINYPYVIKNLKTRPKRRSSFSNFPRRKENIDAYFMPKMKQKGYLPDDSLFTYGKHTKAKMNVEEFKANSLDYQIRLLKFNAILQQRITRRKNVEANQYLLGRQLDEKQPPTDRLKRYSTAKPMNPKFKRMDCSEMGVYFGWMEKIGDSCLVDSSEFENEFAENLKEMLEEHKRFITTPYLNNHERHDLRKVMRVLNYNINVMKHVSRIHKSDYFAFRLIIQYFKDDIKGFILASPLKVKLLEKVAQLEKFEEKIQQLPKLINNPEYTEIQSRFLNYNKNPKKYAPEHKKRESRKTPLGRFVTEDLVTRKHLRGNQDRRSLKMFPPNIIIDPTGDSSDLDSPSSLAHSLSASFLQLSMDLVNADSDRNNELPIRSVSAIRISKSHTPPLKLKKSLKNSFSAASPPAKSNATSPKYKWDMKLKNKKGSRRPSATPKTAQNEEMFNFLDKIDQDSEQEKTDGVSLSPPKIDSPRQTWSVKNQSNYLNMDLSKTEQSIKYDLKDVGSNNSSSIKSKENQEREHEEPTTKVKAEILVKRTEGRTETEEKKFSSITAKYHNFMLTKEKAEREGLALNEGPPKAKMETKQQSKLRSLIKMKSIKHNQSTDYEQPIHNMVIMEENSASITHSPESSPLHLRRNFNKLRMEEELPDIVPERLEIIRKVECEVITDEEEETEVILNKTPEELESIHHIKLEPKINKLNVVISPSTFGIANEEEHIQKFKNLRETARLRHKFNNENKKMAQSQRNSEKQNGIEAQYQLSSFQKVKEPFVRKCPSPLRKYHGFDFQIRSNSGKTVFKKFKADLRKIEGVNKNMKLKYPMNLAAIIRQSQERYMNPCKVLKPTQFNLSIKKDLLPSISTPNLINYYTSSRSEERVEIENKIRNMRMEGDTKHNSQTRKSESPMLGGSSVESETIYFTRREGNQDRSHQATQSNISNLNKWDSTNYISFNEAASTSGKENLETGRNTQRNKQFLDIGAEFQGNKVVSHPTNYFSPFSTTARSHKILNFKGEEENLVINEEIGQISPQHSYAMTNRVKGKQHRKERKNPRGIFSVSLYPTGELCVKKANQNPLVIRKFLSKPSVGSAEHGNLFTKRREQFSPAAQFYTPRGPGKVNKLRMKPRVFSTGSAYK